MLFGPQTRASIYCWSVIYCRSTVNPASAPDWHSSRDNMISLPLKTTLHGFKQHFVRIVNGTRCQPPTPMAKQTLWAGKCTRSSKIPDKIAPTHAWYPELCIFLQKVCTLYCKTHLPYVETWLSSDRLPSLITSLCTSDTDSAHFLSVWKFACLRGKGTHISGLTGMFVFVYKGTCVSFSQWYTMILLAKCTFKDPAETLLMSFLCPLPHILLLCRLTKVQTLNRLPKHDQMQKHWQANISTATVPKVSWCDLKEYVDSCDLLLCKTSVSPSKTRDWWKDTKTHSNSKWCYGGGDWGIIINDEHAAGQRCSLKTCLPSPRGPNGPSINWQADVLEFLSWALPGYGDAGLQRFENRCGFPINHVLQVLWSAGWYASLEIRVCFLKALCRRHLIFLHFFQCHRNSTLSCIPSQTAHQLILNI